jgi:hypothetical protein
MEAGCVADVSEEEFCVCMYIFMYVCMYVCMSVCVCVCVCVCMHALSPS